MNATPPLLALWAKSDAGGRPHSLLGHLLDTAAVGELIWDEFMAPAVRGRLDEACGGHGRDVFVLVCGWHDLGKASPAFQLKDRTLAVEAQRQGWPMPVPDVTFRSANDSHANVGRRIAQVALERMGASGLSWVLPLIAGHHGSYLFRRAPSKRGGGLRGEWAAGQQALACLVISEMTIVVPRSGLSVPAHGTQIAMSGFVCMADWIASSDRFPGSGTDPVEAGLARSRAQSAWASLGFGPGWRATTLSPTAPELLVQHRFGLSPRPVQAAVVRAAEGLREPGLLIVEAAMGEGKTEAALAAAEVIATCLGCSGFAFAMPTQGTTDAMYDRCEVWAHAIDPDFPVALLHGKAITNQRWRAALDAVRLSGIDEYGVPDDYGGSVDDRRAPSSGVPTDWILGRHRGLLAHGAVGTVDQILIAAANVKYVMMRHAGLAGKVVIIDEVHSYDVHMSQFLHELLAWCAAGRIPVVLMSATLPPAMRDELVNSYRRGSTAPLSDEGPVIDVAPGGGGGSCIEPLVAPYPAVTTWTPSGGIRTTTAPSFRDSLLVTVEVPGVTDHLAALGDLAAAEVASGGVALVILNTVARAQDVFARVRAMGVPCRLLHGRLTTARRASLTQDLVRLLGPSAAPPGKRPKQLVVVATQVAEQSFDVDADLLITDLAPIDLLLQRIGRLHRHTRSETDRPERLGAPRVLVSGVRFDDPGCPPVLAEASTYVYARYSLLRAALAIRDAPIGWRIPTEVPSLVAAGYDADAPWPDGWADLAAEALRELRHSEYDRRRHAESFLLRVPTGAPDLTNCMGNPQEDRKAERVIVRDGDETLEVVLVRTVGGQFTTLSGRPLGPNGERSQDPVVAAELLGDTVRVRWGRGLEDLRPLPGWEMNRHLRYSPALPLDADGFAHDAWGTATYDDEMGLVIKWAGGHQ